MIAFARATPTDAEVIRTRDHAAMMARPALWPGHPILYLTKGHPNPITSEPEEYGYMVAIREFQCTVFVGLAMFGPPVPRDYHSIEAIAADGWIVD